MQTTLTKRLNNMKKKQITDVASQTSPPKRFQLQGTGTTTEQFLEKSGKEHILFPDDSHSCPIDIQEEREHTITASNGDSSKYPLTSTTPHIEERLVRDEQTNELYLPLSSTVVLKRKQEKLYVPLDFHNNLTIDALVDSGAYVSAIAQDELDTIRQKAPNNIFTINHPPNVQTEVADGQLDKPFETTTLNFDIGNSVFAEHFVVIQKLTGPIIGLHFMWNNSVVIDRTHGLVHFPHLTMQIKATSEMSAKPQAVLADDALTIPPRQQKQSKLLLTIPRNGIQQVQ